MRSIFVCPLLVTALFLSESRAGDVVDFERQIVPLFAKHGCNGGACHGSFDGRGGFRLSLFSYDPRADYLAITRGEEGRRINLIDPKESLLLMKPLLKIGHQGGRRFDADSESARLITAWIAAGAPHKIGSGRVEKIWIEGLPRQIAPLSEPTDLPPFTVRVRFADGTESDVTRFAELRTQDESIAEVVSPGRLWFHTFGETVLSAHYLGEAATQSVLIPRPRSTGPSRTLSAANPIDQFIAQKHSALGVSPTERSTDEEFLRRITMHAIGALPAPEDVRRFLLDHRPDKRFRKIDELLAHPLHAAMWATKFSEWTGNDTDMFPGELPLQTHYAQMWQDWFRERFAQNVPYDEIVRGVLCSVSRDGEPVSEWIEREAALVHQIRAGHLEEYPKQKHLDLFWRRGDDDSFPAEDVAERLAAVFLGVRIQCAQCHKHPFDRWTQTDYRAFANIFTQVRHGQSTELRIGLLDALEARRAQKAEPKPPPLAKLTEIYLTDRIHDLKDPVSGEPLVPKPLGGSAFLSATDRREQLADWLASDGKDQLARAFVNRLWAMYFGRGLVEPIDAFSATNPPTHPELLEWLTQEFLDSGYDIRHLERIVLNSESYQLSSRSPSGPENDPRNYAQCQVQVLPAATAVDVLHDALGVPIDWGNEALTGKRAIELGATKVRQELVDRMFELFGRPLRKTPCDCERTSSATVRQSLFLMSDEQILEKLRSGRLKTLLETPLSEEAVIEELFLAALSRFPTPGEREAARQFVEQAESREHGFEGLWWAILNTREFLTIH